MLNNDQQYAKGLMDKGYNVFLTGEAGTGKSYVLNEYIKDCEDKKKQVMVVAPTGIAALNVSGATIHRAFRAPIGPIIDKPKQLPKTLLNVDVLICDEISMCRIDLFDFMIYQVMKAIQYRRNHGKKDIQIIVVGDFFQLPPVLTPKDNEVLKHIYKNLGKGFAFESKFWKYCGFIKVILREPMRQSNDSFLSNLNKARIGDRSCVRYFNDNASSFYDDNVLSIVGKNATAEAINTAKVNELVGPMKTYIADVDGQVKDSDKVAPEVIDIKTGARVIMLVNEPSGKYSNGSFGTIRYFNEDYMKIEMDDSGALCKIEKYTWEILDYTVSNRSLKSKVIGTYKQFPIKIGYAITIHKSQGQTYDKVNIDPKCWDCGQLYVALSRCKSIERLHLLSPIYENYLVTSDTVKRFYEDN